MPDGPDLRALTWVLGEPWGVARPRSCDGCPFAGQPADPRFVACTLLGLAPVEKERPACTPAHWRQRCRIELDLLECDSALLAAVARDAREESSMYARGLAEGAAAEREACCRAACPDCAAGRPVQSDVSGWWHPGMAATTGPRCRADAIRKRAEEDGR